MVNITIENEYVTLGLSPRGGLALVRMAKATAFMEDRDYVVPEDITDSIEAVAAHRLVLNSKAKANGVSAEDIISELKTSVEIP